MEGSAPLEGIVVVELGTSVAAPYAGLILADLGARVIKIENPDSGDHARGWGPPFWGDDASVFHALNRGKESLAIDLSDPAEAARLCELILDQADAVIQNLRPGLLKRFKIDADFLRKAKPELVWCDIGAFGDSGPCAGKPGYDPLAQAMSGIMSINGESGDRPPVRVGVSLVDMGSGMWTVIGLLSSLVARGRSGKGARVRGSLYETGLAWMTVPLAAYASSGEVRRPWGSGTAEIVPYQAFRTRDGWLMIAAGNDGLFRKLSRELGLAHLATDPAYETNAARVVNRVPLIEMLDVAVAPLSIEELAERLDRVGVPNAPLLTVDQAIAHPQFAAVDMAVRCEGDTLPLIGQPLSFDGRRFAARRRAPGLGEHNSTLQPTQRSEEKQPQDTDVR